MKYIFLLSGDYINLAKEEVLSLFDVENYKIVNRLLIVEVENEESLTKLSKRLALTKNIYKLLFECKINELIEMMKNYDWNSVYKGNFCLRVRYLNKNNNENSIMKKSINKNPIKNYSEKNLAGYIWRSLTNPKVNLENPKTKIELFFMDNVVYCGLLIFKNNEDFESRKTHLRPFPNPSSLHPKLARALVNIVGVKENEILLDPFCGTGGFLIEAGLMGIKVVGYDINKIMTDGCKENLKHFKIKNFKIKNKNALEINDKFDYVVTDLPYGLNSNVYLQYNEKSINEKSNKINLKSYRNKVSGELENRQFSSNKKNQIKNIEMFYLKFLKKLRKILKKKLVIIFPNYVNYKNLLKRSKFKLEKEFSIYVHRSLTRKIALVKNQ